MNCWIGCFQPEDSAVLLASDCWYNVFPKCWASCFKPVGSAVPLASDITKTLIKLLCSFGHCWLCDSPLSKASDKSIFCCYHLCLLPAGEAAFSRLEKVRIDGGLWLFYCRETWASEEIKPKSMRNSYKCVCGFTVRKEMCFYFIMTWWNKMKCVLKMVHRENKRHMDTDL